MKKLLPIILCLALLCGCTGTKPDTTDPSDPSVPQVTHPDLVADEVVQIPYASRYDTETTIVLSDDGITVNGGAETDTVFTSHDIVYYEEKTVYESGRPYGAGSEKDMHSADEALAHTVVNITAPGAYRVSGKLSAGQIRIDLGEEAETDEAAVVELILDNADITCTVAPAVLFYRVYECDNEWSEETATAEVDTAKAGAVLVLEGENTVSGSYVAKIYKDKDGEKKRWKQDGALYSYMSMNVFGPGSLELHAENEGLDTELHLTIQGGNIRIYSQDDGINTNEDNVSVVTVNGGTLHIVAGLGSEGDGIDSNGFLVINGGIVVSSANPISDSGLDSDRGTFIHGGTVVALGSTMDGAEADSAQEAMNLQFSTALTSALVLTYSDGTVAFAYDPSADPIMAGVSRRYSGAVVSSPNLHEGQTYRLYVGGSVTGTHADGVYDPTTVTAYSGGTQQSYSGTGGFGMPGGMGRPDGMGDPGQMQPPTGEAPDKPDGEMPTMPDGGIPTMPDGEMPTMPGGEIPTMPDGEMPTMPDGEAPELPNGGMGRPDGMGRPGDAGTDAEASVDFTLTSRVVTFSGIAAA